MVKAYCGSAMKLSLGYNRLLVIGIVMGFLAAVLQAVFQLQPPVANGISFLGHPRDLLNWAVDNLTGANWPVTRAFLVYPPMTVIGVVIGSFIAAAKNNELKLKPGPVRKKTMAVIFGFLVANFGLLWGACDMRTALLVSYGSVLAVVALIAVFAGVFLAARYMQYSARKGINQ
jgi:flagellar biosynthesis protein FliQ